MRFPIAMAALLCLSACATGVETRIDTAPPVLVEGKKTYILSMPEGPPPVLTRQALDMVEAKLAAKGMTRAGDPETAALNVVLALSNRPSEMSYVSAGTAYAGTVRKTLFKKCDIREHRANIVITQTSDASTVYRGSAAEYHCKAPFAETMKRLVAAALSGFDDQVGQRIEHPKVRN